MLDKAKEILGKVLEWWNKFTSKQKTIIISAGSGVLFAFVILIVVFSRPKYEETYQCESTAEAAEVINVLEGAGIQYKTSEDGLTISVLKEQVSNANITLGAAGIPSKGYGIDNVTDGGFSTTEADKQRRYKVYLEGELETDIAKMTAIKSADVRLTIPEQDGTLIRSEEESSAWILLELEGDFTSDNASYLARAVATALGNETTNNITILDVDGNLLFSGENEYSTVGIAGSQLTVRQQAETMVINSVKKVLLGTNQFNTIEVASSLDIDFSDSQSTTHSYSAPEGREEGMITQQDTYNSESSGGTTGVPGTTSNEGTTYQIQDNDYSNSSITEEHVERVPNESIVSSNIPAGAINFANSAISVTAISYNVIKEEDAKNQGLLDGISWEEYKAANQERTKIEIDEDLYSVVANATRIDRENITILAYRENWFVDKEGINIDWSDVVSVILILLILGLLGFVVLRSMADNKEVVDKEEELSVEALLQSTPESELEDIELETKSEVRKMIEKFVDENPEAVANLLRNWLNEDWG